MDERIIDDIGRVAPRSGETELRSLLGCFLFQADDVFKRIGVLSGGERGRYALLRLLLHPSNFLLLDEPTNHLDMRAKDVLLEALAKYTGTVVFVSHDRYFIDRLATRVFEVGDGRVEVYPGNYEDYAWRKQGGVAAVSVPTLEDVPGWKSRNVAHARGESGNGARSSHAESSSGVASEAANGNGADDTKRQEKRLNPIKRKQMEGRVQEIEEEIARAETAIAQRETALLTFVSAEETQRVSKELEAHRSGLAALMEEWEELSSELEGAS